MQGAGGVATKISELLTREERRGLFQLFCLMLVAMCLETVGIGLVLPTLTLLADGQSSFLPIVVRVVGTGNRETLIVAAMSTLVVVYFLKNAFLGFLVWRQTRYTHTLTSNLAQRMFALYLAQPYTFHLQRNSTQLVNNIIAEVSTFTVEGVGPALMLCAESLVMAALVGLLFSVELRGAAIAIAIVLALAILFRTLIGPRSLRWGVARQYHEERALLYLREGLGAVKDIIVSGRRDDFIGRFSAHSAGHAEAAQRHDAVQLGAKLVLEFLAIVALAAVTITMIAHGHAASVVLPTLGLFSAVAFRILPSLNRILTSVQQLRFAFPALDRLTTDMSTLERSIPAARGRSGNQLQTIRFANVSYQYPGAESLALRHIDVCIARGDSIGIVGASGSGKSTLINILLGLLTPSSGHIFVDGKDIQADLREWQDHIGYVPQDIFLTDDTLRRNVAFGVPDDQIDDATVMRAIGAAQLGDLVTALPQGLQTRLGEDGLRFSGGERQRVGIARALYHDPQVLVFDEATSALDTETEKSVVNTIRALQAEKTIIVVAHRRSTIAHCDHVFALADGRLSRE